MLVAFICGYYLLLLLLYLFLFTKCQLCCWGALFFKEKVKSTNKGLNETWYPFLLTVTNDFDLHNVIMSLLSRLLLK